MIKEIKYKGLSTTPSDYKSQDGDLAAAENIIFNSGGDINTAQDAIDVISLGEYKPLYIHKPNQLSTNYICHYSGSLYFKRGSSSATLISSISGETINKVTSIGLVLIVSTNSGIHYYSWKEDSTSYATLDVSNLDLKMEFAFTRNDLENPEGEAAGSGRKKFYVENAIPSSGNLTDSQKTLIRAAIKSAIDYDEKNNRFYAPFLLRYAIRMYDGNLAYISSPVLMLPHTGPVAYAYRNGISNNAIVETFSCFLQNTVLSTNLEDYKDLIRDIVIAITPLIPNIELDADGNYIIEDELATRGDTDEHNVPDCYKYFSISKNDFPTGQQTQRDKYAKYNPVFMLIKNEQDPTSSSEIKCVQTRTLSQNEYKDKILYSSNFYIIKSYTVEQIQRLYDSSEGEFITIELDNYPLKNLTALKTIDDDVYCLSKFSNAKVTFSYNGRLNIANFSQSVFNGYIPQLAQTYCEGWYHNAGYALYKDTQYKTKVEVTEEGTLYNIKNGTAGSPYEEIISRGALQYFYYPKSSANKATIYRVRETTPLNYEYHKKTVILQSATILNGSMYIDADFTNHFTDGQPETGWEQSTVTEWSGITDSNISIEYTNRILSSPTNNPYIFSVDNAASVSSNKIIAAATSAKELSQGQFGQYPIYLFTNDGVWAAEISDDGTVVKIVPLSKDVICSEGQSILQIENSILFATDKGIMEISGSQSRCLSLTMDSDNPKSISTNQSITSVINAIKGSIFNAPVSFKTYITNCRMFSDYINNRIIIFNPSYNYSYTYDIYNKVFTIIQVGFNDNINSYPNSYAVTYNSSTYKVVDVKSMTPTSFSSSTVKHGWFLTRPISLGDPNMPKIIDYALQNGVFRNYRRMTNEEISSIHTSFELYAWKLNDDVIYTKNATPSIGDYVYDRHDNRINNMIVDSYLEGTPPMIDVSIDSQIITVSYDRYTSGDMVFDMPDTAQYARDNNAFVSDSIQQVLFGSNDLVNWVVISSSRSHRISDYSGSPYKWFRLAVKCSFKPGESLSSVTFSFRNKFANDKLL